MPEERPIKTCDDVTEYLTEARRENPRRTWDDDALDVLAIVIRGERPEK